MLFLAVTVPLAVLAKSPRPLTLSALALTVVTYLCAVRVTFPVGSAWTHPTQLAFVPMLFVLPVPLVPLIVAMCSILELWPQAVRGG